MMNRYNRRAWRLALNTDSPKYACVETGKLMRNRASTPSVALGAGNSIAIIIKHVAGNLRSRFTDFLTADGEKPDRNRDAEFEMAAPASREQLLAWWEAGFATVVASIEALAPEDLDRTVYIRQEAFLVVEALNRSATHTAYHVGQIVYLAKHFAGPAFTTLTVPKGKSANAKGGYKKNP